MLETSLVLRQHTNMPRTVRQSERVTQHECREAGTGSLVFLGYTGPAQSCFTTALQEQQLLEPRDSAQWWRRPREAPSRLCQHFPRGPQEGAPFWQSGWGSCSCEAS